MKNPRIKASTSQVIVLALLFGFAIFFFTYPFIHFWSFVLAISSIGIAIITLHRKQVVEPKTSGIYIVGVVNEVHYEKSDQKTGTEIKRFDVYPRKIDLENDLLAMKGQNNVTISGIAGTGKSVLTCFLINEMKQFKKIIFQFDPQDHYKEMGIPTLFLNKYAPDVFKDPNSFAEAWETAFQGDATTYRAIPDIVKGIASRSRNWQEFKKILDDEIKQLGKADIITVGAYNAIKRQLSRVYMDKVMEYSIPDNLVISFEGMDIRAFQFYGDWILRNLYKELLQANSTRAGTMLVIDEASQFKNEEKPILPSIMALIRKRGSLLMGTQFVSDLKGIRGNARTQLAFYTNEGTDLDEVKKISDVYHWIIQRLQPHEFIDLSQSGSQNGIFVYSLKNPVPDYKQVIEWKPDETEEKDEANSKSEGSKELNIPDEIIKLLNQPANQQDLAKRFVKEFGKTVDYWKMNLKESLKNLVLQREISATETEYVKWDSNNPNKAYLIKKAIIYHKKNDYSYHDWLVQISADILYHKGFTPKIQPHGLPLSDILAETPKRIAVEIEIGTKNGYKLEETKKRIQDFERDGYEVFVIVPNVEVKPKYKDFKNVMTPLELWGKEI